MDTPETIHEKTAGKVPHDASEVTLVDPSVTGELPAGREVRSFMDNEKLAIYGFAAALLTKYPNGMPSLGTEEIAAASMRMIEALPDAAVIDPAIGMGYTTAGLAAWWKVSTSTVLRKYRRGSMFGLRLKRRLIFPGFQFDHHGAILPGVLDVLAQAAASMAGDDWEAARWIVATIEPAPILHINHGDIDRAHELLEVFIQGRGES